MEIAVNNNKLVELEGNTHREQQPEDIEVVKARIPKYIKIGGHKVLTPKGIVSFDNRPYLVPDETFAHPVYVVYGDKRCFNCNIPYEMIKAAVDSNQILIILRIPKRKTGNTFAFSQDLKTVMSYRKWRLANATNLFVIGEATGTEHQTIEEFIRSEADFEEGLELEELKEQFLALEDPNLIVKDVNRLIHLYYQETANNGNSVPKKQSKKAK